MPGRQVPRNLVSADRAGHKSQNEPKAARKGPGCERGLVTCWQVRLAAWGREAASQGPGKGFRGLEPGAGRASPRGWWQGLEATGRVWGTREACP